MVTFCTRKLLWASSIFLLSPALSTRAQQAPGITGQTYTLPALIDSAQRHLPVLRQKKALVLAARAGITDARHSFLPDAYLGDEISVGSDNALPGSYYSFGIIPSVSSGISPTNNYQAAGGNIAFLNNEYDLVTFGLKNATVHRAEANADLSQADLDREVYLLKWQIAKLYLDIRKSQLQLSIDSENINRYARLYLVIRAVTLSGIRAGADSSLALAELSGARTTYNKTDGLLRQLNEQVSFLTGIAADRILVDTSRIADNLAEKTPADAGIKWPDPDSIRRPNPLTDYYTKQRSLYEQTEELVKKSYLPKIVLSGIAMARGSSIDYQDNYKSLPSGWGYERFNYLAGLTFQYNLFNPVHRRDKEAIYHHEAIASEYDLQQQQLSLQNVGNKAQQGILTAMKNLGEIPIQIHAAEAAFDQKTAQYKAGIINLVDLTNAGYILYQSQSDYVLAVSDWMLANLDKAAANGRLDQFIQTIQ
jgi:outer membrane protein TolC